MTDPTPRRPLPRWPRAGRRLRTGGGDTRAQCQRRRNAEESTVSARTPLVQRRLATNAGAYSRISHPHRMANADAFSRIRP